MHPVMTGLRIYMHQNLNQVLPNISLRKTYLMILNLKIELE